MQSSRTLANRLGRFCRRAADLFFRAIEGRLLLVLALLTIGGCLWRAAVEAPYWNWNDIRLARTVAAVRGYDIYASPESGVLPGQIYGPLSFFLYAPAAWFDRPQAALGAGALLSALWTLAPAALLLLGPAIPGRSQWWSIRLFCVVVFHLYWAGAAQGVWNVHVDAPAIGLAALCAYACLRLESRPASWGWALAAALAAAGSVWSKQTMAPILVVPAVYLYFVGQARAAVRTLALTAAAGLAFGALFGWLYGFRDLTFTMFETPARQTLHAGQLLAAYGRVSDLLDILVLAVIGGFCFALLPGRRRLDRLLRPGLFLGALGCAFLPLAILGRIKIDGAANNYGAPDYFVSLGAALFLSGLAADKDFRGAIASAARRALALLLLFEAGRTAPFLAKAAYESRLRPEPAAIQAFRAARAYPGRIWLPWHPLAALLAEDRLDHTGFAIKGRADAGYPVGDAQLWESLPPQLEYIATVWPLYSTLDSRFPEFSEQVKLPELPGWRVRRRQADAAGQR